jgi:hypothetical protein
MLQAVGARCNQLTDDPHEVLDLCEPPGDRLVITDGSGLLANWQSRIGYAQPGMPPTMVTLTLRDPAPASGTNLTAAIERDTDPENPVRIPLGAVATLNATEAVATLDISKLGAGLKAFLSGPYMPGYGGVLIGGDPNRNGTFGAELGGALIKPGDPAKSFLVQRIRGIVPPRMPLANGVLTDEQLYVIQCWILQMAPDGSNADGPIDYARCPTQF